jgi:hypothetical protein
MLFVLYLAVFAVLIVALTRGVEWLQQRRGRTVGIIEVFTAVLALSTCIQVWAFIQSERSFVSITGMSIEGGKITTGKPLSLSIELRNSGRTSAFIEASNVSVSIAKTGMPPNPQYLEGHSVLKGPVVAGGIKTATTITKANDGENDLFLDDEVKGINQGTKKVYIFGYVRFTDEFSWFGGTTVGYCALYNPSGDPTHSVFNDCDLDNYVYAK